MQKSKIILPSVFLFSFVFVRFFKEGFLPEQKTNEPPTIAIHAVENGNAPLLMETLWKMRK